MGPGDLGFYKGDYALGQSNDHEGMERLGHLIDQTIDNNDWEPLFLSQRGPSVSHLFFSDYLILFFRVDSQGKYLGMPVFHRRVSTNTFQFVVDKVRAKLNGWDARRLSLAKRIILAKSVLFAIPIYFMNIAHIFISVCKEIEKIARNFIWESSVSERKLALVILWDCCLPIKKRGLSILD
ncbi:hypothetical protein PVK06_007809 [Gossypium arboreum]|uniref:Uncharacterized protein n=1 Tax=Gossypium arboreum TaxID=29729 RepID=A0ABR0QIC6_GOSAR|nr:hypothetical protein PVK06_007809 [Gossypium arboreum]